MVSRLVFRLKINRAFLQVLNNSSCSTQEHGKYSEAFVRESTEEAIYRARITLFDFNFPLTAGRVKHLHIVELWRYPWFRLLQPLTRERLGVTAVETPGYFLIVHSHV